MTAHGLTPVQHRCLLFIRQFVEKNGFSPTYAEIAEALGLASKAGVWRMVHGLVERGYLTVLRDRARSIALTEAA